MEKKKKLGQEPAFAVSAALSGGEYIYEAGMSKGFYAACAAMQGVLSNPVIMEVYQSAEKNEREGVKPWEHLISGCYAWADELLKQENK